MQTTLALSADGSFVNDLDALLYFIRSNSVHDTCKIFMDFCRRFPHAIDVGCGINKALFIEGSRPNRCIMVAHADTFWSFGRQFFDDHGFNDVIVSAGRVRSATSKTGIGADDRAGVAIIWQLAALGHSILITDGEECGALGAKYVAERWSDWDAVQKRHTFCVEFDRRGISDFKTYDVGTPEFNAYVSKSINRPIAEPHSFSDISYACTKIPGANLGVGYYNEHTAKEYVDIHEWMSTIEVARSWLSSELPYFKLGEQR